MQRFAKGLAKWWRKLTDPIEKARLKEQKRTAEVARLLERNEQAGRKDQRDQ